MPPLPTVAASRTVRRWSAVKPDPSNVIPVTSIRCGRVIDSFTAVIVYCRPPGVIAIGLLRHRTRPTALLRRHIGDMLRGLRFGLRELGPRLLAHALRGVDRLSGCVRDGLLVLLRDGQ